MRGLSFFKRTNQDRHWIIAAYHSPHSITWRWCLSLRLFRADEWRVWPLWSSYRMPGGLLHWTIRIPFLGFVAWAAQRPMWYRDSYMTLRNRVDQENGMLWLPDSNPEKIHRKSRTPQPPPNIVHGPDTLQ